MPLWETAHQPESSALCTVIMPLAYRLHVFPKLLSTVSRPAFSSVSTVLCICNTFRFIYNTALFILGSPSLLNELLNMYIH